MRIVIRPEHRPHPNGQRKVIEVFTIIADGWSAGPDFKTYDGAVKVANAIADAAVNESGIVTIDYSACLERSR